LNIQTAEYIHSAHSVQELLHDGRPEVAFVGRSNVGKSSLLNALVGTKQGRRSLARTSSTPGRTQTINYFLVNDRIWFVDLPGYGYAKTSKERRRAWAKTVEHYFEQALPAATVVLLIDAKVGGTALDAGAWDYLTSRGSEPVVVATKADKVPRGKRHGARATLRENVGLPADVPVHEVSSTTGEGIKELLAEITARLQDRVQERAQAPPARSRRDHG
jgi:GTP-binding protein